MPDDVAERFIDRKADAAGFRWIEASAAANRIDHLSDGGEVVGAAVELHPEIMRGFRIGSG